MKQISRRDFMHLSTAAAVGALVTACAKAPEKEETTATTAPKQEATPQKTPPTATPEPAQKPWPRENVPRNRTYIQMFQGSGGEYGDVGVCGPWASGFCHQCGHAASLEGLVYFSAHGNKEYPWVAESYEYNSDATQLTIRIRKGVEWSDGVPFTAKDVQFTLQTLLDRAPDLRDSAAIKLWVDKIETVDDYTVRLTFKEANWRFMSDWLTFRFDRGIYMVPEHIYKDVEGDYREFKFSDPAKGWPVVTGPYRITEDVATHKHFDLRYDWWAAKTGFAQNPAPERIIMLPFSDHTVAAQMLLQNEVDQGPEFPPVTIKSILEQGPQIITHSGRDKPYGYVDWWPLSMFFNCQEKPYDDARFRWAVALTIDQQQLVEIGQIGAGQVTAVPYPFYPPLMPYIDGIKDIIAKYDPLEVNLQKSADLMKEMGFEKDAEGFWVDKEGKRPDCDIYASPTFFADIGPLVAEHMRKGGFFANHVSPPDVWAAKSDGRARLHMYGHGGSIADPYYTLEFYHSRNAKPTGQDCGNNRARWGHPDLDKIIDDMQVTPMGDAKVMDLFRAGMEIWLRELPEVPLIQYYHRIGYNTTYWTNWPTEDNPYINGAQRHLTFPILLWNIKPAQ